MRLENIAMVLRPRTAWEAIDLGYAMTQTWWASLIRAWCAVYLPMALLINLVCWKYPPLAVIILWWLKPLFDRVVLHVLSGAVFGAAPKLGETLRSLKRLWWKNGLFAALTYARFNPARSFTLPVVQLEGVRGKLATKRRRVLAREGSGAAIGLTIMSMFVEVTVLFSVYLLINLFSPGEPVFSFDLQSMMNPDKDRAAHYLSNLINAVVISALEPFYVAAGFAIYLNCRTAIEGWDVELQFKRMAARLASQQVVTEQAGVSASNSVVQRAAAALVIASGLAFAFAPIDDARAQTQTPQEEASTDIKQTPVERPGDAPVDGEDSDRPDDSVTPDTGAGDAAKRVLDGKEFGEFQKSWRIKYVGPSWGEDRSKRKSDQKWIAALAEFFASGARVFAWIGGALLVLFLIYLIARHVGLNGWRVGKSRDVPEVLFGLDVRPESLPDNVTDAAKNLLAAGDIRGAVSLMYRGALVSLIQDGRIEISRGDTELQLVARVHRAYGTDAGGDAKAAYFATLVSIWQCVAYARQAIAPAEITLLIDNWASHFNVRRNQTTGAAFTLSATSEVAR